MQQGKEVLVTGPKSSERSEQPTLSGLREAEIALADPLKEETRKARLYLLGVSMVSITIVWTGLVPQEITTLGIKFGQANRQALLFILALVVFYFLLAFAIYGASDYLQSRYAFVNAVWSERLAESRRQREKHFREVEEAQAKFDRARATEDEARAALDIAQKRVRSTQEELRKARAAADKHDQEELEKTGAAAEEHGVALDIDKAKQRFLDNYRQYDEAPWALYSAERAGANAKHREAVRAVEKRNRDVEDAAFEARKAEKEIKRIEKRGPGGGYELSLDAPKEETLAFEAAQVIERYSTFAPGVSRTRGIFEFLLPLFVGGYAIYALLAA